MIVYIVFCKDYEHKKGELMGMLVERRKETRGDETRWESGAKWARQAFGHLVKDSKDIFVYPKKFQIDDKGLLVERGLFSKEEFLEVMRKIDQEMKS